MLQFAWLLIGLVAGGSADDIKYAFGPSSHVTALQPETFEELVFGTGSTPLYFPVILTHVEWCEHCKAALPQFHAAADEVAKAFGGTTKYAPRFFTLDCSDEGNEPHCETVSDKKYPSIRMYRNAPLTPDRFVKLNFDRPRVRDTIAWWVHRMAFPPVAKLESLDVLPSIVNYEATFIMCSPKEEEEMDDDLNEGPSHTDEELKAFEWAAVPWLAHARFVVHYAGAGEKGKQTCLDLLKAEAAPGITVKAPEDWGIEALEWEEGKPITEESADRYIRFNRLPALHMNMSSGMVYDAGYNGKFPVMLLAVDSAAAARTKQTEQMEEEMEIFERFAREHRAEMNFLYGAVDLAQKDMMEACARNFPLVKNTLKLRNREQVATVFIVHSTTEVQNYWEDEDILNVRTLSIENAERLMADEWSSNRNSKEFVNYAAAFHKRLFKLFYRYVISGGPEAVLGSVIAAVLFGICYLTLKAVIAVVSALLEGMWNVFFGRKAEKAKVEDAPPAQDDKAATGDAGDVRKRK